MGLSRYPGYSTSLRKKKELLVYIIFLFHFLYGFNKFFFWFIDNCLRQFCEIHYRFRLFIGSAKLFQQLLTFLVISWFFHVLFVIPLLQENYINNFHQNGIYQYIGFFPIYWFFLHVIVYTWVIEIILVFDFLYGMEIP